MILVTKYNFLIGKVYIIHAHDCEINFGCWLQESKCAFLDDDDENGSVQSQNLEMSWSFVAVIQLKQSTLAIIFQKIVILIFVVDLKVQLSIYISDVLA